MRKSNFLAIQIVISWRKLFLGKGKTEEGVGFRNREQLRVEQDRRLQIHVVEMRNDPGCHLAHEVVLGEPVLVPDLKEHLVPHRVQLEF